MNAHAKTFGSSSGEPSNTTGSTLQQKCEKSWTLPKSEKGGLTTEVPEEEGDFLRD